VVFNPGHRIGKQVNLIYVATSAAPQTPDILRLNVDIPFKPNTHSGEVISASVLPVKPTAPPVVALSKRSLHWQRGGPMNEKTVTISTPTGVTVSLRPLDPVMSELISLKLELAGEGGGYTLKVRPLDQNGAQNNMFMLMVHDANQHSLQPLVVNVTVN
jgi:hypothetical protein